MNGLKVFGVIIAVIVLLAALAAGGWAWRYYTAEVRGVVDAEQTIQSGDYRIDRYELFYDLCASVQRQKASLQAQQQSIENAEGKDRSRMQQNINGLKSQIQGTVSRYNSLARRDYTAGQFRDDNLPYQLNVEGDTTCNQ